MASEGKLSVRDRIAKLTQKNEDRQSKATNKTRSHLPQLPDENKDESIKPPTIPIPHLPDTKPPKSPSTGKRALPPPPPLEAETDQPAKQARPPIPPLPKENAEDKKVSSTRGKSKLPSPPSFTPEEFPAIPPRVPVQREKKETFPSIPTHGTTSAKTTGAKRLIKVTGFDSSVFEDALRQHFENQTESGGGPVETIRVRNGIALVRFQQEEVTQRVLDHEQKFGKQQLKVESASDPVPNARYSTIRPSSFVISGMSSSTTHESLKDFLETKTKYTVQDLFDLSRAHVSVSFTPDSKPDLTELQMVLQSYKLDGKHLHIEFMHEDDDDDDQSDYMEPLTEKCVLLTGETFRYMELFMKVTVQKRLNKVHVTATFDSEKFEVKLKGQKNDLQKAEKCLENIADDLVVVGEKIEKPGIETFLDSDEAKKGIFEIEKAEKCAIFVSGSIYETFDIHQDEDSNVFSDLDSNPSGGSFQSAGVSETGSKTTNTDPTSEVVDQATGDYVLLHFNEDMAKFKIGVCQFQLKKGKVEDEDVTCAVNVTQTDIEQGDLWSVLKESDQKELQRQLNMKTLLLEWSKKGIVMSTTTGLPYQFMIHVSVKNSGGELRKAIRKTFQMAQTYPEITSMVFYRRTDPVPNDDPCPRFLLNYVDEINKYQKTGHPGVKDIRLVLDRMDDSYVTGVRQEFENLLALSKKHGLKNNLLNMIPKRLRSYSSPLPVKEPSSETFQKDEPLHKHQDTAKTVEVIHLNPVEDQSLIGAETEIQFCSESKERINRALSRFMKHCEANMPPKIVDNPKIHFLSESQIQIFRKRAGRRVEVEVRTDSGRIEIRGYNKDVDSVYARLKIELDRIQEPIQVEKEWTPEKDGPGGNVPEKIGPENTNQASKEPKEAAGSPDPTKEDNRQEDEYDVFGKHVACELRGIKDSAKRSKVKRDIQRVLFDASE